MKFLSFFKVIMAYLFCQMSLMKHHLSTKATVLPPLKKSAKEIGISVESKERPSSLVPKQMLVIFFMSVLDV